MKKIILVSFGLVLYQFSYAQSISRQSIGAIGSGTYSNGVGVIQTVGQPYQTNAYYGSTVEARPGFVQPNSISLEAVSSTLLIHLNVYPNPATDIVHFKTSEDLGHLQIVIYDQLGRLVLSDEVEDLRTYQMDCSSFDDGSYFIQLKGDANMLYQSKLIITK